MFGCLLIFHQITQNKYQIIDQDMYVNAVCLRVDLFKYIEKYIKTYS